SGEALVRRLQASDYAIPTDARGRASLLRALLDGDGDELQAHAVRDVGRILGRALAAPILMLDPHSITVTGSLATPYLVDGIGRERDTWANAIRDTVRIDFAGGERGAYAGVRGAALAVLRRVVYRDSLDRRRAGASPMRFGPEELGQ